MENLERYFSPALDFADQVWQMQNAEGEQQRRLRQALLHSAYMQNYHAHQKSPKQDHTGKWISVMSGSYFLNPAVPFRQTPLQNEKKYVSGYHNHTYYELVFVFQGRYRHFISGTAYELCSGEVCLLPPQVVHREEQLTRADRVLFCGISKAMFENEILRRADRKIQELFRSQAQKRPAPWFLTAHFYSDPRLAALLDAVLKEEIEKEPGYLLIVQGYLIRLLLYILHSDCVQYALPAHGEEESDLLKEILAYMEENLATVTKQETAEYFHFNADYLGRFLLKKTGSTYSQILKYKKMCRAAALLERGTGVNEVIRQLGFSNKGHFNKLFRETYGLLPGAFKKRG